MDFQRLANSRVLTPWPWLAAAFGLGSLTLWLIGRTATRTAEYDLYSFTTSELASSQGPFDTLQFACLIAAGTTIVLAVLAAPGWLISRLFGE